MSERTCRDCGGPDPHERCGSCCECYCAEPSSGDPAYTGICPGCGGYEECYCGEDV